MYERARRNGYLLVVVFETKYKGLELVSVVHLENEDVLFYSRGKEEEEEEEEERIDKVSPGKKHRFARINGIEQQQRVDDDDTAEEARG